MMVVSVQALAFMTGVALSALINITLGSPGVSGDTLVSP